MVSLKWCVHRIGCLGYVAMVVGFKMHCVFGTGSATSVVPLYIINPILEAISFVIRDVTE